MVLVQSEQTTMLFIQVQPLELLLEEEDEELEEELDDEVVQMRFWKPVPAPPSL